MDSAERQENTIERFVRLAGGPTKAANACGVSGSSIYQWIELDYVPKMKHGVLLAMAAGVPIAFELWELAGLPPEEYPGGHPTREGEAPGALRAVPPRETEAADPNDRPAAHLTQRRLYGPPTRKRQFPAYNAPETETDFRNAA